MLLLFASCKNNNKTIVSASFIDSLIRNYSDSVIQQSVETDLQFWYARIDPANPGMVNELKYASMLVQRYHLQGNIHDVLMADNILNTADRAFDHKETAPNMALLRNSILRHRFKMADSLLTNAREIGIKKYESAATGFDVAFELGYYGLAENELKKNGRHKRLWLQFSTCKAGTLYW